MQFKVKIKTLYASLAIFLFLLYMYINSTRLLIYRSDKIALLSLALSMFLLLICIKRFRIRRNALWDVYWMIAIAFVTIRNRDLSAKNYIEYAETIACVLMIILASHIGNWHGMFLKIVGILGAGHIVLGFVFYAIPNFYVNRVVPLMKLDVYWEFRIREMLNSGYMVGFTTHYSTLGIYLSIVLALVFSQLFVKPRKKDNYLYIYLAITVIAFLLNRKRGPFLFVLISAAIVYMIGIYKGTLNRFMKLIVALIFGGIVFVVAANTFDPLINFLQRFQNAQDFNTLASGRVVDLWLPALLMFRRAPVTGIGWRGFVYSFHTYSNMVQDNDAHNIFLQLLCETGIVGFMFFVFLFIATYIKSIKILRAYVAQDAHVQIAKVKEMLLFSLIIQTFFLLEGLVGNTLYGMTFYIYALSVAFVYSVDNKTFTIM